MKLLTAGNPKIEKGLKKGFLPFILHLAPANLSGYETCPKRTEGCTAACLNTAGRGGMFKPGGTNTIQEARKRKTRMFFEERKGFMEWLVKDIELGIKQSVKKDLTPVFRLNGTSDLSFEKYEVTRGGVVYKNIFEAFPEVQFYDYTAVLGRKVAGINNYHLTFSAKESNTKDVEKALELGMNVAMVFDKLPVTFMDRVVFDGDQDDLRFKDPKNVIVGLKAKGRARKDTSGFVRRVIQISKV
jgi:hypothetical protein